MDLQVWFCPTYFVAEAANWFWLLDKAVQRQSLAAVELQRAVTERRYDAYIARYRSIALELGSLLSEEIVLAEEDAAVSLNSNVMKVASLHSWKKRLDKRFVEVIRQVYPKPDTLSLERELGVAREAQSAVRSTLVELGAEIRDVLGPLTQKHERGWLTPYDIATARALLSTLQYQYRNRSSLVA